MEDIDGNWGSNPAYSRVKALIREIKRYALTSQYSVLQLEIMQKLKRNKIIKLLLCALALQLGQLYLNISSKY